MADEPTKVSAREVLGTAWEATRKCRPVDESDIRIEVQYVNPDRSQQELAPLDGRADTEEIGKLYGNGRFFLRAKRKSDNTVISQTTVDIRDAAPHPMDLAKAQTPAAAATKDEQLFEDDKDDRISRLEEAIENLAAKLTTPVVPAGQSLADRLMEKILLEKLDGKSSNPMQDPAVMTAMIQNALAMQTKIMSTKLDMQVEDHRQDRDFEFEVKQRRLERDDIAFAAKQKLLLENAQRVTGEASFDPQGGNTMSLLEAIQDIIGIDRGMQVFGVNIAEMLEPMVPKLTKGLQDRGIYVLAKQQLEQMLKHQYEQGIALGQQQALEELTGPDDPAGTQPPDEGAANGPDGGDGIPRPEDNPGPDDTAGGSAGGGGEPEA